MSRTSLIIFGLHTEMTSDEVKQKMSLVFNQPESNYEDLCEALFIAKKPYTLVHDAEVDAVNLRIATLSKIGFKCRGGDTDMGLSIMRVASDSNPNSICPACNQKSGNEDTCQHCHIVISKFLHHKKIDDELERQLNSNSNTQEMFEKLSEEKLANKKLLESYRKENAKARKKDKGIAADRATTTETNADPVVTVAMKKKRFSLCMQP